MKQIPLNPTDKICSHIDAIFGTGVSNLLPQDLNFEYSKRSGRIRNFSIGTHLVGTMRTDGGIALTIFGAEELLKNKQFIENCIIPIYEAIPFISEGRSLFCKHVEWCGSNVKVGSDVAIIDRYRRVLAIGRALLGANLMKRYYKGVAVKVREGIKGRAR